MSRRVFKMETPPEPGPEVTRVQDANGEVWGRVEGSWNLVGQPTTRPWGVLVDVYGPLTDGTPLPPAPRTWDLPAEPGPEVTRVRDCDGEVWTRAGEDWEHASSWLSIKWPAMYRYAPLTDATGEADA